MKTMSLKHKLPKFKVKLFGLLVFLRLHLLFKNLIQPVLDIDFFLYCICTVIFHSYSAFCVAVITCITNKKEETGFSK